MPTTTTSRIERRLARARKRERDAGHTTLPRWYHSPRCRECFGVRDARAPIGERCFCGGAR